MKIALHSIGRQAMQEILCFFLASGTRQIYKCEQKTWKPVLCIYACNEIGEMNSTGTSADDYYYFMK